MSSLNFALFLLIDSKVVMIQNMGYPKGSTILSFRYNGDKFVEYNNAKFITYHRYFKRSETEDGVTDVLDRNLGELVEYIDEVPIKIQDIDYKSMTEDLDHTKIAARLKALQLCVIPSVDPNKPIFKDSFEKYFLPNLAVANYLRATPRITRNHDAMKKDYSKQVITNQSFVGKDLSGANFEGSTLTNVNFTNANLTGANFSATSLVNVIFRGAILEGTNFQRATLVNTNTTGQGLRIPSGVDQLNRIGRVYSKFPVNHTGGYLQTGGVLENTDYVNYFLPQSFEIIDNASSVVKGIGCQLYKITF